MHPKIIPREARGNEVADKMIADFLEKSLKALGTSDKDTPIKTRYCVKYLNRVKSKNWLQWLIIIALIYLSSGTAFSLLWQGSHCEGTFYSWSLNILPIKISFLWFPDPSVLMAQWFESFFFLSVWITLEECHDGSDLMTNRGEIWYK